MFKPACQILIAAAIAVSLAACGKKRNNGGGTLDGGGGDPVLATREQVVKAVNDSWSLLTKTTPANPLISAEYVLADLLWPITGKLDTNDPEIREAQKAHAMLAKIFSLPPDRRIGFPRPKFPNIEQLGKKRLQMLEKGLCSGSAHKATTASVTKLSMEGEICVSIDGLQRLATASLSHAVLALLVHEIAHLVGYDEDDAKFLENYFIKNIDKILRKDGAGARASYRDAVDRLSGLKLIRYDFLDGQFMAALRVQLEMTAFLSVAMRGAAEDEINVAQPEMEEKAHAALSEALSMLIVMDTWWIKNNSNWKPIPVTKEHLEKIREIALALLNARQLLTEYLGFNSDDFPDEIKAGWPKEREALIKYTDPKALTDPSLRVNTKEELRGLY